MTTPTNLSLLQRTKYTLTFTRIPAVTYFLQAVNLPGASTSEIVHPTPLSDLYVPGDKIHHENLTCSFLLDEDLRSWFEIHEWMVGLTFPDNFDQYKGMKDRMKALNRSSDGVYSDAILTIHNNANVPAIRVKFKDCFPTELSGIQFDAKASADDVMTGEATFRFSSVSYERL